MYIEGRRSTFFYFSYRWTILHACEKICVLTFEGPTIWTFSMIDLFTFWRKITNKIIQNDRPLMNWTLWNVDAISVVLCRSKIVDLSKMDPFTYMIWALRFDGPFRKMDLLTYSMDLAIRLLSFVRKNHWSFQEGSTIWIFEGWNSDTVHNYGPHMISFIF